MARLCMLKRHHLEVVQGRVKGVGNPAGARSLPWIRFSPLLLGWTDEVDLLKDRGGEYIRNNRDRHRCQQKVKFEI
jgi:hypothetical protein